MSRFRRVEARTGTTERTLLRVDDRGKATQKHAFLNFPGKMIFLI